MRNASMYAFVVAVPTAAAISGVRPGTAVRFPAEMPAKSAGSDEAGRPAEVAAGATSRGR